MKASCGAGFRRCYIRATAAPGDHAWPCCRFMKMSCRTARRCALPARARLVFVVHGEITVAGRGLGDGEAWHGEAALTLAAGAAGATVWRWELAADAAPRARMPRAAPASLRAKARGPARHAAAGRAAAARRQRRLSARRLRLSAPPPGAGHPLPRRRRHAHRHPRALDLLWAGRRLVRERARAGVRAGRRRPAEPLHPGDDPAARADRQELDPVCRPRPTATSRGCSSTRFSPTRRSRGRGVSVTTETNGCSRNKRSARACVPSPACGGGSGWGNAPHRPSCVPPPQPSPASGGGSARLAALSKSSHHDRQRRTHAALAAASGCFISRSRGKTSRAKRVRLSTVSACDIAPAWPIIRRLPMPPQ